MLVGTWLADHEYEDAFAEWGRHSGPYGEERVGCPLCGAPPGDYPAAVLLTEPEPDLFWRCDAGHGEQTRFVVEERVKHDATLLRRLLERAAHA
jgi:hypothetical protein